MNDSATSDLPLLEITPRRAFSFGFSEIARYHELLYFLTWRDVKVRYKQTVLGVLWALIQPLGMMLVFTLFLGRLARVPSDGIAYPFFVFPGLLLWQLFAAGLNESANSVVASERLITKVYFPRAVVPGSAILSALVDFAIGMAIFLVVLVASGRAPGVAIVFAPLCIVAAVVAALGAGLWLSALNVQFRDVRYVLGFLTQLWLFATPVVYPVSLVPERWRVAYSLNPMAGIVAGFRWSVVGGPQPPASILVASIVSTMILLISGFLYFRRMEDTFADVI